MYTNLNYSKLETFNKTLIEFNNELDSYYELKEEGEIIVKQSILNNLNIIFEKLRKQ